MQRVLIQGSYPALRFLVAGGILAIADDPYRSNALIVIHAEDDTPVTITNHDFAPAGKRSAKRLAGSLPNLFKPDQLCEQARKHVRLDKACQILDRLID
jgi:hypothetical protein